MVDGTIPVCQHKLCHSARELPSGDRHVAKHPDMECASAGQQAQLPRPSPCHAWPRPRVGAARRVATPLTRRPLARPCPRAPKSVALVNAILCTGTVQYRCDSTRYGAAVPVQLYSKQQEAFAGGVTPALGPSDLSKDWPSYGSAGRAGRRHERRPIRCATLLRVRCPRCLCAGPRRLGAIASAFSRCSVPVCV